MQRVRTDSGSVYDVDHVGMRIRRVHGRHGPSDTQPQDGIWRHFVGLEGPEVGQTMVVYWATQGSGTETNLGFRTTVVLEIEEFEPEPESVQAPGLLPSRDGSVPPAHLEGPLDVLADERPEG
jgi:hypothetical protein